MNRNSRVSSRVRMCCPSTSASAISTILWYRSFSMSNSSWMPVPSAVISAWTSLFLSTRSIRAFSTLRILPRIGRIAWVPGSRPCLAEPPAGAAGRFALDDEPLGYRRVGGLAVGQLARHRTGLQQRLAAGQLAGLGGGDPGPGRLGGLRDDRLGLARVTLQPVGEPLVGDLLDEALHVGVAELGLGLPLELGVGQLHRDDRGQALPDVLTGELLVALEQLLVRAVLVHDAGQRRPEALLVGTALVGVDGIGERVHRLAVRLVPLHRDLDGHPVALGTELDHRLVDRALGLVEVPDEVGDAVLVAEGDLLLLVGGTFPLVAQGDGQAAIEEGHLLQAPVDGLEDELDRLEDLRVRPERQAGPGLPGDLALLQLAGLGVAVLLAPDVPILVDLDVDPGGQRVDHGDADPVQAAGDRVRLAVELATGVQHGQRPLDRGPLLHRVDVDRDAAAVVDHPDAAVGEQGDLDRVAVAGERLVDRVVNHLPDQVVQPPLAGRADVHAGALADRFQPFEDGDGRRVVLARLLLRRCHSRSLSRPYLRWPRRRPGGVTRSTGRARACSCPGRAGGAGAPVAVETAGPSGRYLSALLSRRQSYWVLARESVRGTPQIAVAARTGQAETPPTHPVPRTALAP